MAFPGCSTAVHKSVVPGFVYPWVLAHPFCISLSGPLYPRHMNQDGYERIGVKALSAEVMHGFPTAAPHNGHSRFVGVTGSLVIVADI